MGKQGSVTYSTDQEHKVSSTVCLMPGLDGFGKHFHLNGMASNF